VSADVISIERGRAIRVRKAFAMHLALGHAGEACAECGRPIDPDQRNGFDVKLGLVWHFVCAIKVGRG
jgi:hypothetical protein